MITVRGKRAAMILSVEDYDLLRRDRPSLVDHLLSGPEWDDEPVEVVNARSEPAEHSFDI